jgi:hypothetical protein
MKRRRKRGWHYFWFRVAKQLNVGESGKIVNFDAQWENDHSGKGGAEEYIFVWMGLNWMDGMVGRECVRMGWSGKAVVSVGNGLG